MGTATLIKDNLEGWRGHAALYKCEPPLEDHEYVIASGVNAMLTGDEVLLWKSDKDGISGGTLDSGSIRGTQSHEEAFAQAGYTVEPD